MSYSNKFLNILKNCQKHEYQDKYIIFNENVFYNDGDL